MVEKIHINVDTLAAMSDQTLPSPEVLFQRLSLRYSCVGLSCQSMPFSGCF